MSELAVKDGKMTGLRATLQSDQGAFYADAQPTKFRAGLFHIVTGSYDIPAALGRFDAAVLACGVAHAISTQFGTQPMYGNPIEARH